MNYPGQPNGAWRTVTTAAGGMSATVRTARWAGAPNSRSRSAASRSAPSCQLWVIGPGGSRTLAGGWVTDDQEGAVWYPGSAGLAASGVRGFQVTVGGPGPSR